MIPKTPWLSAASILVVSTFAFGCDGGPLPLQVEAREIIPGPSDQIELFVKTEPGVDLTYNNRTESTGESPNHSIKVPKSELKLGKNTFTVNGVGGNRKGSATATLDVTPKLFVHFQSTPDAVQDGTFTCVGSMCGATAIAYSKAGKMPLIVTSDIGATITMDGQAHKLAAGGKDTLTVDLVAKLAQTPVTGNEELSLPFTVEANGEKADANLTLRGNGMTDLAVRELGKVTLGPLLFAGETASNSPPTSLVVIGAPSAPLLLVGKAKTFQDVDLVAVGTPSERVFPCPSGAGLLYVDLQTKVYARRTGALVSTKNLSADRTTCPPTPAAQPLKSAVREDDTKRVLAELLKK